MLRRRPDRPGYALLAVLIVVVVLALAAYRFADAMTAEYRVAVRSTEAAQAKAFAAAGVHFAAGALADPGTMSGTLGNDPWDHQGTFGNVSVGPQDGPRGGGRFSLMGVGDTGAGSGDGRYQVRFGPTDEQGKLNVNALIQLDPSGQVLRDALLKLPNMTEDVADAIVDWVDPDDTPRESGAESAAYGGTPQGRAKNGPLNSVDELLLVRGVTPALLFGTDRNRNGRADPGEEAGGDFSRGWADFLTAYGRELNVDSAGAPRVHVGDRNADLADLSKKLADAVGQEMSDYILAARLYGTSNVGGSGSGGTGSSGGGSSGGGAASRGTGGSAGGSSGGTTGGSRGASGGTSGGAGRATATAPVPAGPSGPTAAGSGSSGIMALGDAKDVPFATLGGGGAGVGNQTITGGAKELREAVQRSVDGQAAARNRVSSALALHNTQVTLPKPPNSPPGAPTVVVPSPLNDPAKMKDLLPKLLDKTTGRRAFELPPRVNVNTAPPEVLLALPGLTQADVDAILSARGSLDPADPATTTGAWLVTQANVPAATFRRLEQYVTGRTMTYRVHAVGYFGRGGPVARAEAVVDTNRGHPRIVYYRDLTDLGKGFDPPR